MKNKTLRSLSLVVVLLSETAGISISSRNLERSADASTLIATLSNEPVHPSSVQPIRMADGPEEVPPAAVLVADGPEEVPPAVRIADGPEEVPPSASRTT